MIKVHIRAKPCDKDCIWTCEKNVLSYVKHNKRIAYDCFDSVYFSESTMQIYDTEVLPAIQEFIEGRDATVLAYGQTGSGKTYTMSGELQDGLIYMALRDILPRSISMSYIEIYNEKVYDLCTGKELGVYSKDCATFITNQHIEEISNEAQAHIFLGLCEYNRRTSQTEYNKKSSRSHTILQITNEKAVLNFIDLAGSEKASTNESRRKEGSYINKSLLALGKLINNLATMHYSGYRESKLTRILRQSLTSKTRIVVFCMISTMAQCLDESLNSLQFAARMSNLILKSSEEQQHAAMDAIPAICGYQTVEWRSERPSPSLIASIDSAVRLHGACIVYIPSGKAEAGYRPEHDVSSRPASDDASYITDSYATCDEYEMNKPETSTKCAVETKDAPEKEHKSWIDLEIEYLQNMNEKALNELDAEYMVDLENKSALLADKSGAGIYDDERSEDLCADSQSEASFVCGPKEGPYARCEQAGCAAQLRSTFEIYDRRVNALENMVSELLEKNPNRLLSKIFILEKQMFNLRKEMLSKKRSGVIALSRLSDTN